MMMWNTQAWLLPLALVECGNDSVPALAINRAGSPDRARVRDALEPVRGYPGPVGYCPRPFAPGRRDAPDQGDVFMVRYAREDQTIVRIRP